MQLTDNNGNTYIGGATVVVTSHDVWIRTMDRHAACESKELVPGTNAESKLFGADLSQLVAPVLARAFMALPLQVILPTMTPTALWT